MVKLHHGKIFVTRKSAICSFWKEHELQCRIMDVHIGVLLPALYKAIDRKIPFSSRISPHIIGINSGEDEGCYLGSNLAVLAYTLVIRPTTSVT
jgi:hypothetical protein